MYYIMKKIILGLLLISIASITMKAQEGDGTLNKVGDKAPEFICTTIDGVTINSKDLVGKVIMVNFFATWCPPCKKELPVLQKNIAEKYANNKDFVLVVLGREHSMDEMKEYAKKTGLLLPFSPDPERKIYSKYASVTIPRNVIIDKKGNISYQAIGFTEEEFKVIEDHVAGLLK
jgi:peroxiredoxin